MPIEGLAEKRAAKGLALGYGKWSGEAAMAQLRRQLDAACSALDGCIGSWEDVAMQPKLPLPR